jgi:hypothetical protein
MSWEELNAIMRQAAAEHEQNRATPPQACPNDGEPLDTDPRTGELRCGFDGWVWDGGPVTW